MMPSCARLSTRAARGGIVLPPSTRAIAAESRLEAAERAEDQKVTGQVDVH
jgi:hypothetical protein